MLRYILIFVVLLISLFTLELLPWGQYWLVQPFTQVIAQLSGQLLQLFDQDVNAQGIVLFDSRSGFSVSIEAGCNGVEATLVLMAAMLAFPAGWRMKLFGILTGFLAIQVMNLLRIISLFYLGQWNMQAFEWAHLYLWQSLIILDVLVVFLIWLRYIAKENPVVVNT
jgi:exosortase H (IPTLxxWG-CTERM-specific)